MAGERRLLPLDKGAISATADAWRRYAPLVRGILNRGLGPHADVDDAAQEVFLRLFRSIGKSRDATGLRSQLISFTDGVMKAQLRRRLLRESLRVPSINERPEVRTPHLDAERREMVRRICEILDRLKPIDRRIFVLRQTEQLELTEIAEAVALSLATVKRRLGRVCPRVRRWLELDPMLAAYLSQDGRGLGEGTHRRARSSIERDGVNIHGQGPCASGVED